MMQDIRDDGASTTLRLLGLLGLVFGLALVLLTTQSGLALQQPDVLVTDPINDSNVEGTGRDGTIATVNVGETITAFVQISNESEVEIAPGLEVQVSLVAVGTDSTTDVPIISFESESILGSHATLRCVNFAQGFESGNNASCIINRALDPLNTDPNETGDSATLQIEIGTGALEPDFTYRFTATANPAGDSPIESDATNNQGTGQFIVFPVRPNLIIPATTTFSPSSPRQGDLLTVQFEVENDSRQPIDTAFTSSISYREVISSNGSNQFGTYIELNPPAINCPLCLGLTLSAGTRQVLQAQIPTILIPAGNYQFRIEVDSSGVEGIGIVDETDETDNALIFDLTLGQPTRNLSISGGQVLQSISLNTVRVIFDVTNFSGVAAQNVGLSIELQGLEDPLGEPLVVEQPEFTCTPATSFVGGSISTNLAPCDTISQIGPGETLTVQASFDSTGLDLGNYDIVVAVDPLGQFDETNESDNTLSAFLVLSDLPQGAARGPELHPITIDLIPDSPIEQGTSILVITNVKNSGNQNAENFIVRFSIRPEDGSSVGFVVFETKLIELLKLGIDTDVKATLQTSELDPGLYSIQVDLISTNQTELDENNNSIRAQFSIVEASE